MVVRSDAWLAISLVAAIACGGCAEEKPKPPQVSAPQDVTFYSPDSAHLVGTWQTVNGSRAVVICVPTVGFTRSSWSKTTRFLTDRGWSVLSFDLRGEGDSHIPPRSTWKWSPRDSASAIESFAKDILGAIQFVRGTADRPPKIILLGADIAGVAALYATTARLGQTVTGVTLLTPPGGLDRLLAGGLVVRYGDRPLMIMTEQPLSATEGTARTLDSWLGRGSAITLRLSAPEETTMLESRQAALTKLLRWIESATLRSG